MHDDKMPRLSQRHKPDNRRGRQDSLGLFQPSSEPGDHLLEGSWPWVGNRDEIVTSEPGQCFFLCSKIKGSNLISIYSWRVLSTPTGPYQELQCMSIAHHGQMVVLVQMFIMILEMVVMFDVVIMVAMDIKVAINIMVPWTSWFS